MNIRHAPAYTQLIFSRGSRRHRADIHPRFVSTDARAIKEAMLAGGGLAALPLLCVEEELSAGLAEVVLADYELHATPLSLLFPAGRRRSARVEVVAQFLQEAMA